MLNRILPSCTRFTNHIPRSTNHIPRSRLHYTSNSSRDDIVGGIANIMLVATGTFATLGAVTGGARYAYLGWKESPDPITAAAMVPASGVVGAIRVQSVT